jgi:hypothetical protein
MNKHPYREAPKKKAKRMLSKFREMDKETREVLFLVYGAQTVFTIFTFIKWMIGLYLVFGPLILFLVGVPITSKVFILSAGCSAAFFIVSFLAALVTFDIWGPKLQRRIAEAKVLLQEKKEKSLEEVSFED